MNIRRFLSGMVGTTAAMAVAVSLPCPLHSAEANGPPAAPLSAFKHPGKPNDIAGLWKAVPSKPQAVPLTSTGEPVPMRPETERLYRHRAEMNMRGTPVVNTSANCLPSLPTATFELFLGPYLIVQSPQQVVFLVEAGEMSDQPWVIRLDRSHPRDLKPSYHGDSVGHWEGATLVVDSTGFNQATWLGFGMPHSEQLHLVSRISKVAAGAGLQVEVTVEDPVAFTKPWTRTYLSGYSPNLQILETHCLENVRPENNDHMLYEELQPIPGVNHR